MKKIVVILPLMLTFALCLMASYALPEVAWSLANPASADTDPTFFLVGFIGLAIVFLAAHIWGAKWLLHGAGEDD
ncbi:hypothetical protein [Rathayibacter sp. AY1A7]|uniref:hypothetical protein n=1 Tax=Rathayibacter sp. AY1A7 TaxID=2080524 RepID=UPI000CE87B3A|nr:hypothetical protein [Rathayibacter sp. AY1A7]PPF18324.1 hypothetical protein C5B95_12020 [Rathayibacter sp. AY1A7]